MSIASVQTSPLLRAHPWAAVHVVDCLADTNLLERPLVQTVLHRTQTVLDEEQWAILSAQGRIVAGSKKDHYHDWSVARPGRQTRNR